MPQYIPHRIERDNFVFLGSTQLQADPVPGQYAIKSLGVNLYVTNERNQSVIYIGCGITDRKNDIAAQLHYEDGKFSFINGVSQTAEWIHAFDISKIANLDEAREAIEQILAKEIPILMKALGL